MNVEEITDRVYNRVISELTESTDIDIVKLFKLKSLSKDELRWLNTDLRAFVGVPSFDENVNYINGELIIEESYKKVTKSPQQVKRNLMNRLSLKDWQIQEINGKNGIRLMILFGEIGTNDRIIKEQMKTLGWFHSYSLKPKIINGIRVVVMGFDPMYQKPIRNTVRSKWKFLFHLSPIENKENILKNGILPKSDNNIFNYPNRVYLLLPSIPQSELAEIADRLRKVRNIPSSQYISFKIDLDKISDNINFYYDPRYMYGVFCNDAIPPQSIVKVCNVEL